MKKSSASVAKLGKLPIAELNFEFSILDSAAVFSTAWSQTCQPGPFGRG
jgi:hypothetical protein